MENDTKTVRPLEISSGNLRRGTPAPRSSSGKVHEEEEKRVDFERGYARIDSDREKEREKEKKIFGCAKDRRSLSVSDRLIDFSIRSH